MYRRWADGLKWFRRICLYCSDFIIPWTKYKYLPHVQRSYPKPLYFCHASHYFSTRMVYSALVKPSNPFFFQLYRRTNGDIVEVSSEGDPDTTLSALNASCRCWTACWFASRNIIRRTLLFDSWWYFNVDKFDCISSVVIKRLRFTSKMIWGSSVLDVTLGDLSRLPCRVYRFGPSG